MAVFKGVIRSQALEMDTSVSVILPYDRMPEGKPDPCGVLYLLHGLGDNNEAWIRYTNVERYARKYGIAIVMPEVQRSFYTDMEYGLKYFTYVADELPELCRTMFRLSGKREDTFVAGLSMGGYGAVKCALSRPERFAWGASFSGALDIISVVGEHGTGEFLSELKSAFGLELKVRECDDLKKLAEKVAKLPENERPGIFFTCGYDDFLYEDNISFKNHLEKVGLGFKYIEWKGAHEWSFWDKSIQLAFEHFFESERL